MVISSNTGFYGGIVDNFSSSANSFTLDMQSGGRTIDSVLVFDFVFADVPEPGTIALMLIGLVCVGISRRKILA